MGKCKTILADGYVLEEAHDCRSKNAPRFRVVMDITTAAGFLQTKAAVKKAIESYVSDGSIYVVKIEVEKR